jgi:hypothetical protein
MKTGATVAAFARPVRLRPVDRISTQCPRASPIAPRTSSLAVQTQRRKLRRTRPERSAWPEPELTSSGSWQPREPMLPDDRDFGPAMARLTQRQRIFVDGLRPQQTAAARRGDYSNRRHADAVVGHRLAHNEKVQAAIREERPACVACGLDDCAERSVASARSNAGPCPKPGLRTGSAVGFIVT